MFKYYYSRPVYIYCMSFRRDIYPRNQYGDINLKQIPQGSASWNFSLYVNAITEEFYIEQDSTYILITVPLQIKKKIKYKSLFKINNTNFSSIKMKQNIPFNFSGTMLTHTQTKDTNISANNNNNIFMNVASYCNKSILSCIKQSFLEI